LPWHPAISANSSRGSIYDLLSRPELVEELRQEIKTVLAANDGVMTTHALFEMKLLDSVMKESQRHNPGNLGKSQCSFSEDAGASAIEAKD
jgi:hypothetical protein